MTREWCCIDKLRLDKFLMLIRKFISCIFMVFSREHWSPMVISQYLDTCVEKKLFQIFHDRNTPHIGITYHLCDLYIIEMINMCRRFKEQIPKRLLQKLIRPFIQTIISANMVYCVLLVCCKDEILARLTDKIVKLSEKRVPLIKPVSAWKVYDVLFSLAA